MIDWGQAFTFLRMGADLERISIMPLTADDATEQEIEMAEKAHSPSVYLHTSRFEVAKQAHSEAVRGAKVMGRGGPARPWGAGIRQQNVRKRNNSNTHQ